MIFQLYPISTRKHASDSLDRRRTAGTLDGLPGWNRDGASLPRARGLTGGRRFAEAPRPRWPNAQPVVLLEGARLTKECQRVTADSHPIHRRDAVELTDLDMFITAVAFAAPALLGVVEFLA